MEEYIVLKSVVKKRLALVDPTKQPKVPLHRHREELQTRVALAIDILYTYNHPKIKQPAHLTTMAETANASDVRPPKSVIYCGICSLPPEVGTTPRRRKKYRLSKH